MQAMMGVVMDTQVAPNLADPGRYYYFANPALARLSGDVAHNPMYSISSNSIGSVWTRKLYDGSRAVAFVNHQFDTNTLFTTNVTWSQLGYQSNQLCGVYDVWNQAWVTNAYGGFGTTASNMSASVYFVYPTNTAAPVLTTVPISAYYNVWGNTIQWASVYPGATALMFFSGSGDNMAEFLIPKELVTTTTLQVRYRLHSNAAGTIPLYQLVGWEKANVSGNSAVVTGVTVAANTSIYYTNTFTVVANPDAVGIRLGITSASTNHLRLENIQVIAQ